MLVVAMSSLRINLRVSLDVMKPIDLNGKTILLTGGTGSFGRQFTRTVLAHFNPRKLIIFSRDELKQYEMQTELNPKQNETPLRFFLGDVRDVNRLEMAMRDVDYVVHAAALKQVPAAEYNPIECIRTNVYGAENVVMASLRCHVKKVLALSTDKAASPVNLYGASKLASDKIFIAANKLSGDIGTRFSVVRYGNVLGSRGSVVPLFQRLISEGCTEIPITDPRMTRFWITIDKGVQFVLNSLEVMQGGEIFIPKIPSMSVTDLAKALAPNLEHKIIGIRPGEKLHETMITEDDARHTIELGDRYVILPSTDTKWTRDGVYANATQVDEGFHYSSDNNSDWLDEDALRCMLESGDN